MSVLLLLLCTAVRASGSARLACVLVLSVAPSRCVLLRSIRLPLPACSARSAGSVTKINNGEDPSISHFTHLHHLHLFISARGPSRLDLLAHAGSPPTRPDPHSISITQNNIRIKLLLSYWVYYRRCTGGVWCVVCGVVHYTSKTAVLLLYYHPVCMIQQYIVVVPQRESNSAGKEQ